MITTSLVAYLALFITVGVAFLFAALFLGRFLRARVATREKLAIYECGEPAIGSSQVQFDLRFYVVALVFLIFDVEVAFFFPWAAVFGTTTQLMDAADPVVVSRSAEESPQLSPSATARLRQLGVTRPGLPDPTADAATNRRRIETDARHLALAAMADIGVFFAVLMVGFAYVWYRGDLDWVRAVSRQPAVGDG